MTKPLNKDFLNDFVIGTVLSFGIKYLGLACVSNIFINFSLYGWFGFDSVLTQIAFCRHISPLIFLIITLVVGFLLDYFIFKKIFRSRLRKIFWIWLFILIFSYLVGHYRTVNAAGEFMISNFDRFKYLVCY